MTKPTKMFFILISLLILFPNKSITQQYQDKNLDKINVFKQPNDSTLAYYGSLDVNKDNVLNWDDYNKMVAEAPQIDEADLNGNGIPSDPQDIQIAADYFNGNIEYIPAQWNKLPTREERIDWLDKMLAIDQTDTITYNYPDWASGDYGVQTSLNFKGHKFHNQEEKELAAVKYDTTNLARFNMPVWHSAFSKPGVGHGQNAINVGNNAKNPHDYVYPDQQEKGPLSDLFILGENWNPSANSAISVDELTNPFENSQGIVRFRIETLVTFKSGDNSILNLYYQNPNLIETREQAMDETYPYLTLTAPEEGSLQNSKQTSINISGDDQYFDRIGYSLNNSDTTWFSTPDTSFYINSKEGNNELLAIAEDKAGNQTLEKRTYTVDSTYVNVEDNKNIPKGYSLEQNYPNPFNPLTKIHYTLPEEAGVTISIYDLVGRRINQIILSKQTIGNHSIQWNGTDQQGNQVPAGIYFYQLQASDFVQTKKMVLMK